MANTTWSTTDKTASVTLSGSNLIATATSTPAGVRGKDPKRAGKLYFEITGTIWANAATCVGVISAAPSLATLPTVILNNFFVVKNGNIWVNGAVAAGIPNIGALVNGSIVGIAVDLDARQGFARLCPSGNWNGSATANPATGVGGVDLSAAGLGAGIDVYPVALFNTTSDAATGNFGGTAFSGTVPSGYTSGWDDTIAALSMVVPTQLGAEAWASTSPNVNVTQIGEEAFVIPNPDFQLTQAGSEVWLAGTPALQLTQAGLEMWATVATTTVQMTLTQAGLEVWRTVADAPKGGPMISMIS
jgi:hypothetical protein